MTESYPDDNPKTVFGISKPSIADIPPIAIFQLGQAMADGSKKYGRFNFRDKTITASTYYNAAMRHLLAYWDGEQNAEDSNVDHRAHAMACLAIWMDAESMSKLNDDRGLSGKLGEFLKTNTKKI